MGYDLKELGQKLNSYVVVISDWTRKAGDLYFSKTPKKVKVKSLNDKDEVVDIEIPNLISIIGGNSKVAFKAKILYVYASVKEIILKNHSFEIKRFTNQGGVTLKSDSSFITHAGEQDTLDSVVEELRKAYKFSKKEDITAENNIVAADDKVVIAPGLQKKDRKWSDFYLFTRDYLFFAKRLILKATETLQLRTRSPRLWFMDDSGRKKGLIYIPDVNSPDGHSNRALHLAVYNNNGKWRDSLKLLNSNIYVNGRKMARYIHNQFSTLDAYMSIGWYEVRLNDWNKTKVLGAINASFKNRDCFAKGRTLGKFATLRVLESGYYLINAKLYSDNVLRYSHSGRIHFMRLHNDGSTSKTNTIGWGKTKNYELLFIDPMQIKTGATNSSNSRSKVVYLSKGDELYIVVRGNLKMYINPKHTCFNISYLGPRQRY
ncbi:MAG: hypothetical protein GXO02_05100 [Epsilonproteobacteria bacterium]|nr:hypothetical protein [Campylobacterota bacterium]